MRQRPMTILLRGLRGKCPQCGIGSMYRSWNRLALLCPRCGCEFERRSSDSWFFVYMSTAFLTGLIVIWMLLNPMENRFLGEVLVLLAWFVLIVLSLPYRKGMAIAINYLMDSRGCHSNAP